MHRTFFFQLENQQKVVYEKKTGSDSSILDLIISILHGRPLFPFASEPKQTFREIIKDIEKKITKSQLSS